MAIGFPKPEPVILVTPQGPQKAVPIGNGAFTPYKEDPYHIFENFLLCRSCGPALAIIFKRRALEIKYVPLVNNKPLDA